MFRHRGGEARARVADQVRFLSAPELTVLIVLFALAVLTVVAVAAASSRGT
jgi:hypothetical protein